MHQSLSYTEFASGLGVLRIVWRETPTGPIVCRILLPSERIHTKQITGARPASSPVIRQLADQIQSYLKGEAVDFRLSLVDLGECSEFQKGVLLTQCGIPRGWVSTYGRIAMRLGLPGGARAVGTALARNPFPIIIPCHRTIRSNGDLGGFGGGLEMKRVLLELEGVEFSAAGRVLRDRFYW